VISCSQPRYADGRLGTMLEIGGLRWHAEVRRPAGEFAARHPGLFFLLGEPISEPDKVYFETCDARSRFASLAANSSVVEDELRVIPIDKSSRNPYKDRISLGRARNCDIVIRHPSISKLHAHIRVHEDKSYTIADVGSHNGTRIGDRALFPQVAEPLCPNSLIFFGAVAMRVLDAESLRLELLRLLGAVSER
jgi:hypothetical protein